jgi:hypothetical protein
MTENDRELMEGLRALAADGPREAPGRIEERLKWEFRRQNRRRTLMTWVPALSVAAAAGIALLLWIRGEAPKPALATVAVHAVAPAAEEETDSFYPLPEAEALPAVETAMVVRVQLPVSSLRLMGVPLDEERADTDVQAELLLGQDGLARGVRLAE